MKTSLTHLTLTGAILGSMSIQSVFPQDKEKAAESPPAKEEEAAKESSDKSSQEAPARAELEGSFIKTLTKATMHGRWCVIREGELTPEKNEKYSIESVAKLEGNSWVVSARIQYNEVDFVAPIPVKVEWAGDTPVIIVDNLQVPGGSTYSARVLVYDDTYAGTWSGKDVKGLLNGMILREEP